jgi:hypothetical protein
VLRPACYVSMHDEMNMGLPVPAVKLWLCCTKGRADQFHVAYATRNWSAL